MAVHASFSFFLIIFAPILLNISIVWLVQFDRTETIFFSGNNKIYEFFRGSYQLNRISVSICQREETKLPATFCW